MIKQLIEQYPIIFKLILSVVIFASVERNLRFHVKANKNNSNFIFTIQLITLFGLFIFIGSSFTILHNIFISILSVFGISNNVFSWVNFIITFSIFWIVFKLKLKVLKLENYINNLDQKIALEKNSQEYKKHKGKDKFYRSQ